MGHHRQDGRGYRDGVAAQNQFHHAIGKIQGGQAALRHFRGVHKVGVHKKVDLSDANSEEARDHEPGHVSNTRVRKRNAKVEMHTLLHQGGYLHQKLQRSADQHAHRERNRRALEVVPNHAHRKENNRQIQKHRGRGRQSKNVETVQNAHGQGGQANEEQIREYDAIQRDSVIPVQMLRGRWDKGMDYRRRKDHTQNSNHRQYQRQGPKQVIGKLPDLFGRFLAHIGRKYRYKGRAHRAFAHQAPEKIGDAVGQDEGVGDMRSAKKQRIALVPDIPENAASNGAKRDERGGFKYLLLFGQRAALRA